MYGLTYPLPTFSPLREFKWGEKNGGEILTMQTWSRRSWKWCLQLLVLVAFSKNALYNTFPSISVELFFLHKCIVYRECYVTSYSTSGRWSYLWNARRVLEWNFLDFEGYGIHVCYVWRATYKDTIIIIVWLSRDWINVLTKWQFELASLCYMQLQNMYVRRTQKCTCRPI